jgi:hypothetical protein
MVSQTIKLDDYLNYLINLPLSTVHTKLTELLADCLHEKKNIELCSWMNCIHFFLNYDVTDKDVHISLTRNNTIMIKISLNEGVVSIECLDDVFYIQLNEDRWFLPVEGNK